MRAAAAVLFSITALFWRTIKIEITPRFTPVTPAKSEPGSHERVNRRVKPARQLDRSNPLPHGKYLNSRGMKRDVAPALLPSVRREIFLLERDERVTSQRGAAGRRLMIASPGFSLAYVSLCVRVTDRRLAYSRSRA